MLKKVWPAATPQAHTSSPSAFGAFVVCADRVHRIPLLTFVTTAKRPSSRERDGADSAGDLRLRSTATHWHDGQISIGRYTTLSSASLNLQSRDCRMKSRF